MKTKKIGLLFTALLFATVSFLPFSAMALAEEGDIKTGCWTDVYGGNPTPTTAECGNCWFHSHCKVGDTKSYVIAP